MTVTAANASGNPLAGPLPLEPALKVAQQVVSALEDAHARNILHRGLKPANVLITSRDSAKLLDFRLAMAIKPGNRLRITAQLIQASDGTHL